MPSSPIIVGHRGCKGEEPENTLLGIRSALEKGLKSIEIDVHLTKDGRLAVIHDGTLDRTTNGTGAVAELTYDEIKQYDAGKGEYVPLLEEVMDITRDIELFIEIKCTGAEEKVLRLVEERHRTETVIIKSFNHRVVRRVTELNAAVQTGCIIEALPIHAYRLVKDAGADLLSVSSDTIDQALVDECHQHGCRVFVWTAETKQALQRLTAMGVEYIATGSPSRILA